MVPSLWFLVQVSGYRLLVFLSYAQSYTCSKFDSLQGGLFFAHTLDRKSRLTKDGDFKVSMQVDYWLKEQKNKSLKNKSFQ